ncbi:MAG TPA: glycosyltransferase family 4 protein [Ilumatobacteraceae bacterium]|nr:glycosyltransferase family 4 protein [Ilumatobacteraceae bacterium]
MAESESRGNDGHPTPKLLRVGMICPYSLSIPGGVQAQVMGLSRELRRMGIEVRVLAPCDGPPPATFVTPLGNSLPTSANGSIAPLAPDPSCSLRTMRALGDEQFDVLHLHEPFLPGPTHTAMVLHPAPVVATFHAAGDSASYRYLRTIIKPVAANIAYAAAVSKDAAELVQRYLGGDYDILYNGVELDAYRSATPHPTSGPTIFFCGRHEERKGLEVLLAAMGRLGPDVRLWVGGSGPDSARLQASYSDDPRIEWLGRLTDADKISRMRGADVFCAPSLHGESFGVVLIEAMAGNAAIVASALDGYRNVATDGVDAVLVEPGDVPALAAALQRVLFDDELSEKLRDAGARRAEDFSMTTLAHHYAEHYAYLATNRPRRRRPVPGETFWGSWRRRMLAD